MKRRVELIFLIVFPILGVVFSWRKNHESDKRPEQKITTTSSEKVAQKSKEEIKRATGLSKRTRTEGH